MQDDRNMDAFDVIVAELFGDAVDSRELWDVVSKQGDASEVHVKTAKPKDEIPQWQKNVALGTNAAGVVAGPAAIALAIKAAKNKEGGIPREGIRLAAKQKRFPRVSNAAGQSLNFLKNNKKAAIAVGTTGVALQVANMTGDAISTKAFMPKREKEAVAKALADIVDARRKGRISTDDAIRLSSVLIDGVSKAHSPDSDTIHEAAEAIVPLIPSQKVQAANSGYQQGKKLKAKGKSLMPKKAAEPAVQQPITKSAKSEAARIARVGLKAIGDETKTTVRAGAKVAGEEARTTVRAAGQEARTTVKSVGEESRKLPTSVDNTVNEVRGAVKDVRSGVNEARDAVKGAAGSVRDAADNVGGQIRGAADHVANTVNQTGDKLYRKGRKLALIGAGGVAGAATVPVGVAQLGANHRAKKYGVPIGHAPRKRVKKDAGPDIVWTGEIAKRDDEKRQVFGFALVTHVDGEPVVDRQGDFTPLEEIEKAAYTYVIESRKGGDMHSRDGEMPLHTSDMVESFVITPEKLTEMGLAPDALPHGWWVGFQVNDEKQWMDVKSGKRTGFSIHGSGRRVEKSMVSKSAKDETALVGASAGGAGLAAAATPYWEPLPTDKAASARISAGKGTASTADLRAVARGGGKRAGDKKHIARIAQSMTEGGYDAKQPIVVHRYKNGEAMVRNGHHRLAAAEQAGLKDVPVKVIDDPKPGPRTLVTHATRKLVMRHVDKERRPNPARSPDEIKAAASKPEGKVAHAINRTVSRADDVLRDINPKTALKIARKTT